MQSRAIYDGAHLRLECPDRHLVGELAKRTLELVELSLAADGGLGQVADDDVPVGVLGVQLPQRRVIAGIGPREEHRGAPNRLPGDAREAPDELQRYPEAPVRVVNGSDLQRRQVESLSEHVHADDDAALPRTHLLERRATFPGRACYAAPPVRDRRPVPRRRRALRARDRYG